MAACVIIDGLQLAQISSSTGTAVMLFPSGIKAGDLLVGFDAASNNAGPTASNLFTGFTQIFNATGDNLRAIGEYKIASGSESGGVGGMNGGITNNKMMYTFRAGSPIGSVTTGSINTEITNNDPALQTCTSGSGLVPLVVFGCYRSTGTIGTRTFNPAKDGEINSSVNAYLAYKIYNTSPADETVDMTDVGNDNCLASFYLQCSP